MVIKLSKFRFKFSLHLIHQTLESINLAASNSTVTLAINDVFLKKIIKDPHRPIFSKYNKQFQIEFIQGYGINIADFDTRRDKRVSTVIFLKDACVQNLLHA